MRDLFKILLVGIVIFLAPQAFAENYKVLVIPDNIVTESVALDSYIYDGTSEFFADGIVTLLNGTKFIKAPTVSEARDNLKKQPATINAAKKVMSKFRTSYNIDYDTLKKLADATGSRYVLLITSYTDAENYILRRTVWDFLNIPGATVVDPAYKISTYAVLVDTQKNYNLWSDSYQKTISVCENRIITRGPSPQTEQLQKIKDYSRYLCPQIAQNVQVKILPPDILAKESSKIDYDLGDIDNVFTKKYRHLGKETSKEYNKTKAKIIAANNKRKARNLKRKQDKLEAQQEKLLQQQEALLEVKATPVKESSTQAIQESSSSTILNSINNKINTQKNTIETQVKDAVYKKEIITPAQNVQPISYPSSDSGIYIKRTRRNNLYGDFDTDRPDLREYNY